MAFAFLKAALAGGPFDGQLVHVLCEGEFPGRIGLSKDTGGSLQVRNLAYAFTDAGEAEYRLQRGNTYTYWRGPSTADDGPRQGE